MTAVARSSSLVLALSLALAACSDGSGDPAPDGSADGGRGGIIEDLVAVESAATVLGYTVQWRTTIEVGTILDVDCGELGRWTLSGEATARTEHEVFVMGLLAGAHCDLTARALDGGEELDAESVGIDVGSLPAFLPELELTVPDTDGAMEPGWTLFNLNNRFDDIPYTVVLADAEGRIRWYYQASTDERGGDTPVVRLGDGVAFGGRGVPNTVVHWSGRVLWTGSPGHHELQPTGEPGHLLYLGWTGPCGGLTTPSTVIYEVDWMADETVWEWHFCEHYTPDPEFPDWAHGNTADLFPSGDALIFSSRNQNSIMKIDRETGDIVWSMGFDGRVEDGFRGELAMVEEDRFYQQHDPEVLPSGNIVLFDNGHATARPYSRAIEIAYEHVPGGESTASVVWEYRHEPDLYTPIWGDADRLSNGNTLVTFGERQSDQRTTIVEVSPASEPVWELQMPYEWGAYRSERVTEIPKGFVVDAP